MELHSILPEGWPRPKGYSNGILVEGAARYLHIAGQVAWDSDERLVGEGEFARQFEQALSTWSRSSKRRGARRGSSSP